MAKAHYSPVCHFVFHPYSPDVPTITLCMHMVSILVATDALGKIMLLENALRSSRPHEATEFRLLMPLRNADKAYAFDRRKAARCWTRSGSVLEVGDQFKLPTGPEHLPAVLAGYWGDDFHLTVDCKDHGGRRIRPASCIWDFHPQTAADTLLQISIWGQDRGEPDSRTDLLPLDQMLDFLTAEDILAALAC